MKKGSAPDRPRWLALLAGALALGLAGAPARGADAGIPISSTPAVQAPELNNYKSAQLPSVTPTFDSVGYEAEQEDGGMPVVVEPNQSKADQDKADKAKNWLINGFNDAMKAAADKKAAAEAAELKAQQARQVQDGLDDQTPSYTGTNSAVMNDPAYHLRSKQADKPGANGLTDLGYSQFKPLISGISKDTTKPLGDKTAAHGTNSFSMTPAELKALGTTNPDLLRPISFDGVDSNNTNGADPTDGMPKVVGGGASHITGFQVPNAPLNASSPYAGTIAQTALVAPAVPIAPRANLDLPRPTAAPGLSPAATSIPRLSSPGPTPLQKATSSGANRPQVKDPTDISPFH